jgi:hypothetical protein
MDKLAIYDKSDGIKYIHPIIVNECRKFAEKELKPIGAIGGIGIDLMTEVDYNETTFSYIDNNVYCLGSTLKESEPVSMVTIKMNDWGNDESVVVFSPMINKILDTEIYFKITLEHITEDSQKVHRSYWKFKISYCKDWYGSQEIAKEDIKLPIFIKSDYIEKLSKLDDILRKCTHLLDIDMRDKFDVITEEKDTEDADC